MKKLVILIILILVLTPSRTIAAKYNVYTPQTYKQIQIVQSPERRKINGEAVELLVDYSGSMQPWINLVKECLTYILPKIPAGMYVGMRVIGENPYSNGFAYVSPCKSSRMVTYFTKDKNRIIKAITDTKGGGMTPLEFGLSEAVERDLASAQILISNSSNSTKNKRLILLTDGSDTCGGDPCDYIENLVKTRNDIQIDVVHIGSDNTLMCLSNATGGKFYKVDGSKNLFEQAFETLFKVPLGTVESGRTNKVPQNSSSTPSTGKGYKYIPF